MDSNGEPRINLYQGVVKYQEATRHTFHDPRIAALDPRNLKRD